MYRKYLTLAAFPAIVVYALCYRNVNNKYPNYDIHTISDTGQAIIDDIAISVSDYYVLNPEDYTGK